MEKILAAILKAIKILDAKVVFVDGKVTALDNKVGAVDTKVTSFDVDLKNLVSRVKTGFDYMHTQFEKAEERDRTLKLTIEREVEGLAAMTQAGFKDMTERIDQNGSEIRHANHEIAKFNNRTERIENITVDHEERIHKLED